MKHKSDSKNVINKFIKNKENSTDIRALFKIEDINLART